MAKQTRTPKRKDSYESKIDDMLRGAMERDIAPELRPYYDKMIQVQNLLIQGFTGPQVVKYLQTTYEVSQSYGYEIYRDAVTLFGKMHSQIDKEGEKIVHIQKAMRVQQEALKKGNEDLWFKLEQHIVKLKGLLSDEQAAVPVLPPMEITFTHDPKVLNESISKR